MLIELHSICLSEAFAKLLKKPTEGTMAYVRSLPAEVMSQLCADGTLQVDGWSIYFVSNEENSEKRYITADQAVDIREDKRGSVLLLVDTKTAGAGMDGIYSAVREIGESELLPKAINIAEKKLQTKTQRDFADAAVKQARKIGRTNTISPWKEFDFYVKCAAEPNFIGKYVSLLGLWPLFVGDELHKEDLAVSAQIVERLLLPSGAANTPQSRVQSLLLPEEDRDKASELEKFLRDASGLRWTEMAVRAGEFPSLWLNSLNPGFNSQKIVSIELTDWQSRPDAAPNKWTGLVLNNDQEIEFLINDTSKFEIRWKVQPPNLKAGATEYKVSIVTGSDTELVSRQVAHTDKKDQKCVFTQEDFSELDEDGKWQAKVLVHPIDEPPPADISNPSESPRWKESREFILTFGIRDAPTKTSVGKKARALIEEAIKLPEEDFEIVCTQSITEDSQGFINFNVNGKSGRVFRPPLIKLVEENWKQNTFTIGRWIVRVRTDGSRAGAPQFIPIERGEYPPEAWRRLEEITRQLAQRATDRAGFIGLIYHNNDAAVSYINVWTSAIDSGKQDIGLANTIEVQTLNGETIGLIVLPSHPIRVAWHSSYDELAFHARFNEKLPPTDTINTLKMLDGSFVPMFLPGIKSDKSFVFGDTLGFYAVAMIQDDETEPQAMIAQMMRCLSPTNDDVAPTVGITTASAIAREIEKYSVLHPQYRSMHINALRAGDGKTIAQALGLTLKSKNEEETSGSESPQQGYVLNLFPGAGSNKSRLVGRFFAEAAERRRAGVGGAGIVAADERWMLETFEVGNSTLPRLKWAKRKESVPTSAAHLSVAFDIFGSEVITTQESEINQARPIEAFGLIPSIIRQFSLDPVPTWTLTLAPQIEGEKHPSSKGFSDRLHKVHSVIIRATAANLNHQALTAESKWATLKTSFKADQLDFVRRLHELSDWVVSVDRNAGIEYFDAPQDVADVYDTYVIDCVPERQDLDSLQLITSTTKIDEVLQLLEDSLDEMALSRSPRNGRFLLANLKAISGRLAMRLAERGQGRSEMIALAMFYAGCAQFGANGDWPSLKSGFLVPLDDVRDLLPTEKPDNAAQDSEESEQAHSLMRADLVYVDLTKRGVLQFTFVEIKYRRLLKSALDTKLHEYIGKQVSNTRRRWMDTYFSPKLKQTQLVLRRKRLARALRFYLDKAGRHLLEEIERKRLSAAIDKLFRSDTEVSQESTSDCGYVFCPEYDTDIERLQTEEPVQIRIFGAQSLPVLPYRFNKHIRQDKSQSIEQNDLNEIADELEVTIETVLKSSNNDDIPSPKFIHNPEIVFSIPQDVIPPISEGVVLELGSSLASDTPVQWKMAITGNPHLMIAGLPGMGKTTCIINLCEQLIKGGITPIIFSYHDDIETKLGARIGKLNFIDIDNGLGFNPLRIVTPQVHAWLDNIGKLRDIFASIYKDLGDIQLNEIREAIKDSYVEVGYGNSDNPSLLPAPQFKKFYEILRTKSKPNPGIIARLEELNDYGFFSNDTERSSILEMNEPVIVRLHATQNEALQNAMASFALLNIYQNMLLRGSQSSLKHAVIFDEAHRAGKLKLLPTMAKESRKFGISMIVASQEAKDFNDSLYAAIANYLVLRVTETDAKMLAKNVVQSNEANAIAGRLKSLDKYTGMFFTEGKRPVILRLSA